MSGAELLERAISYAFGAVDAISPDSLARATPCPAWDLRALMHHLNDSLAALHEAVDTREVAPPAAELAPEHGVDPMATFRLRAGRLLGAWTVAGRGTSAVGVGGYWMAANLVAMTGAVEITVHGWDVFRTCGRDTPIPAELALDLLQLCPLIVSGEDRSERFGACVPAQSGEPSDLLVAYLGRDPSVRRYV